MASDNDLDKIRDRVDIVNLIGSHTSLRKRGIHYTGLCPFHKEKTPSFTVNPERKFWHCFGCGEGGDIFSFVMKTENVDFPEAVEILARSAGIELTPFRPGPDQAGKKKDKDVILEVNKLAAIYFRKVLAAEKTGAPFREYLDKRGMPPEIVRDYGIGATQDSWDSIVKAFAKKDIGPDALVKAGLATRKDGKTYDRFRRRLMFTIYNTVGDIAGFAGRAMGDDQPKYLNTPETPLFDKSKILYNLHVARKHSKEESIILTEGYMDTLALVKAGFLNVVASMGTSLTGNQIELLRRYCKKVYIAYDSDIAGDAASMRGIELLIGSGLDIRVVSLPGGQDPDDVIRAGGREAFEQCLANAAPHFKYFLSKSIKKRPGGDASALRDIIVEVTPLIMKSPNVLQQDENVRELSETLGLEESRVRAVMSQAGQQRRTYQEKTNAPAPVVLAAGSALEKKLIEYIFSDAKSAATIIERFDPSYFRERKYRELFKYIKQYRERQSGFAPDGFLNDRHPQELVAVISGITLSKQEPDENHERNVRSTINTFVKEVKKRRITELKMQIVRAEKENDRDLTAKLMMEMMKLKKDTL